MTVKNPNKALLNLQSEINIMSWVFASQLGLNIQKTNIGAQKIDDIILKTDKMVVSTFSFIDKDGREMFLEKSFLLANVKSNIVLGKFFLTMNNSNIDFQARDLQLKSYTIGDMLSITRRVKLMVKKKFTVIALEPEHKAFVKHIATFSIDSSDKAHLLRTAQMAHLKADETLV